MKKRKSEGRKKEGSELKGEIHELRMDQKKDK